MRWYFYLVVCNYVNCFIDSSNSQCNMLRKCAKVKRDKSKSTSQARRAEGTPPPDELLPVYISGNWHFANLGPRISPLWDYNPHHALHWILVQDLEDVTLRQYASPPRGCLIPTLKWRRLSFFRSPSERIAWQWMLLLSSNAPPPQEAESLLPCSVLNIAPEYHIHMSHILSSKFHPNTFEHSVWGGVMLDTKN